MYRLLLVISPVAICPSPQHASSGEKKTSDLCWLDQLYHFVDHWLFPSAWAIPLALYRQVLHAGRCLEAAHQQVNAVHQSASRLAEDVAERKRGWCGHGRFVSRSNQREMV